MIGPYRHCPDKFLQLLEIDRFRQMMIEPGSDATAHVFLHAEAAEGDTDKGLSLFGCAHDLTAIAIGQPDVAD